MLNCSLGQRMLKCHHFVAKMAPQAKIGLRTYVYKWRGLQMKNYLRTEQIKTYICKHAGGPCCMCQKLIKVLDVRTHYMQYIWCEPMEDVGHRIGPQIMIALKHFRKRKQRLLSICSSLLSQSLQQKKKMSSLKSVFFCLCLKP